MEDDQVPRMMMLLLKSSSHGVNDSLSWHRPSGATKERQRSEETIDSRSLGVQGVTATISTGLGLILSRGMGGSSLSSKGGFKQNMLCFEMLLNLPYKGLVSNGM